MSRRTGTRALAALSAIALITGGTIVAPAAAVETSGPAVRAIVAPGLSTGAAGPGRAAEIANRAVSPTACRWQGTTTQFYTPPAKLPRKLGAVIRCRTLSIRNLAGTAYRIMYRTETPDGKKRVSTGMVLVPRKQAPRGGRKIVAWSHGTVGLGPQCAPSRTTSKIGGTNQWINAMLRKNWVITATDYAGLGLEGPRAGTQQYLVGKSGAIDTLTSVRAAGLLPHTRASTDYAVFGHSQGGQSALFTGKLHRKYLKGYHLKGIAAADPAAEPTAILDQVWNGSMGWAIGAEVAKAWPAANPALLPEQIVGEAGLARYEFLSSQCILWSSVLAEINLREHGPFFPANPMTNPQWAAFANQQNVPVVRGVPVFVGENTADGVVLPNTVALFQRKWCEAAGKKPSLRLNWLQGTADTPAAGAAIHAQAAQAQSPYVLKWFEQRFAGKRATGNCGTPPPVAPYGS